MQDRPADGVDRAHLPGLDGLRGCAAALVAIYHAWVLGGYAVLDDGPGRAVLGAGYSGVDVFFVLSGVVLMIPFAVRGTRGSLAEFAVRRAARLLPLYLLVMLVAAASHHVLTRASVPLPPSAAGWGLVLQHALLAAQFFPDQHLIGFGSDGVIWTLTIEACFYVALPFVAVWWVRRPGRALAAAVAVAAAWQVAATHVDLPLVDRETLVRQLPAYAAHFGLGLTLAVLLVRTDLLVRLRTRGVRLLLLTMGTLGLLTYLHHEGSLGLVGHTGPFDNITRTWFALPAIGAVVLALAAGGGRLLATPAFRWLGQVSYGLYLVHLLSMRLLTTTFHLPADGSSRSFLVLLATLPVTLLVAHLSYRYVEAPARRRLTRRLTPPGDPDARVHDRGRQLPADGPGPRSVAAARAS